MLTGIAGITLMLVGSFSRGQGIASEPEGKTEKRASTKDQITFIPIKTDQGLFISADKFEVKFKEKGKKTGVAVFESREPHLFWDVTIKRGDGSTIQIPGVPPGPISEVGTVDLAGRGNEDVFFVTTSGGPGGYSIGLSLINSRKGEIVGLLLGFSFQLTEGITHVSTTDNFHSEDFRREREFLESIKYEYGFVSEEEVTKQISNPELAYYFWAQDNGGIEDGKMRIRKHKGKHSSIASINDELKEGSIVYTAYFKAGVVAYDESSDQHFILFHPDNMYSWPTVLEKVGPYLLIGTRGEGLAIVNLETFHLKRFRFPPPNDIISELEVLDSRIRINASKEMDLPSF